MKKEKENKGYFKRFVPYYKPYLPTFGIDLICATLTTLCDLVLPIIVRKITNLALEDIASLTVVI